MPKCTLPSYDTGDVACHGEEVGLDYNAALELMVSDKLLPMYDEPYLDIHQSDCTSPEKAYGWSPETCRLLMSFMAQEGITAFRMQA